MIQNIAAAMVRKKIIWEVLIFLETADGTDIHFRILDLA